MLAARSLALLNLVNVGRKSLADYASISTHGLMAEIHELAGPLAGKRVLHLSATAFGGGVAEINYTLVPLMADVGLEVEWRIIHPTDGFFDVTKTIHNALQGNPEGLTEEQQEIYHRCNAENARLLEGDYDVIIVHDAQPAGMIDTAPSSPTRWIWRCHIDLSDFAVENPRVVVARTFSKAYRHGRSAHRLPRRSSRLDRQDRAWDSDGAVNVLGLSAARAALRRTE